MRTVNTQLSLRICAAKSELRIRAICSGLCYLLGKKTAVWELSLRPWEQRISIWACASAKPDLALLFVGGKNTAALELSLRPWEQRISIWACASAKPVLDFAIFWGEKPQCESCHYAHEKSEYLYKPAHLRSLTWTLLSFGKKKTHKKKKKKHRSVRAVTTPMRTANIHKSLHIRAVWSGLRSFGGKNAVWELSLCPWEQRISKNAVRHFWEGF